MPDKLKISLKLQSEHSSDVVRSTEMIDPLLKKEVVTNLERNTLSF